MPQLIHFYFDVAIEITDSDIPDAVTDENAETKKNWTKLKKKKSKTEEHGEGKFYF